MLVELYAGVLLASAVHEGFHCVGHGGLGGDEGDEFPTIGQQVGNSLRQLFGRALPPTLGHTGVQHVRRVVLPIVRRVKHRERCQAPDQGVGVDDVELAAVAFPLGYLQDGGGVCPW